MCKTVDRAVDRSAEVEEFMKQMDIGILSRVDLRYLRAYTCIPRGLDESELEMYT